MSEDKKQNDATPSPPQQRKKNEGDSPDTLIEMAVIPFFVEGEGDETGEHSNISTPTIAEMRAEDLDFDDDADDTVVIEDADDEDDE